MEHGGHGMAQQLTLEFSGVTAEQYWAVNAAMGIDQDDPAAWPEGIVSHVAGATDDGGWVVTEVWDSREAQARFMDTRLGAALGQVEVPPPSKVQWVDLVANVRL